MPGFYIEPLLERHLGKLRQRQERVRQEIGGFTLMADVFVGQETANAVRAYLDIPCGFRYRGEQLPEIPSEGLPFIDEFLQLNRREAALELKIRNTVFWFYESRVEPYVLWCYGVGWYRIEAMEKDGKLTLSNVERLLDILLHDEPKFPTPEEVVVLRMDVDEVAGWERTFRHRQRHLLWLFQTALRLGEVVVYSMM